MKRAATSAFALTLPQPRSTKVVCIDGRQRIERIPGNELYFVLWGGLLLRWIQRWAHS
jgi:hypothetical protein